MDPDLLEKAVIVVLKKRGFSAVQVLARARYDPESVPGLLASPFMNGVIYWRSLEPIQTVSWVVWIWITAFLYSRPWVKVSKV